MCGVRVHNGQAQKLQDIEKEEKGKIKKFFPLLEKSIF
jgi:hypothetical protein